MPILYELSDGVAVITLDRPEVLNAFDDELGRDALDALQHAAADRAARCVAITGAGRAFSSGEDLAALSETYSKGETPRLDRILSERYNPLIRVIRAMPKPVLAAVNGVAAGAGASLVLACDHRVASDNAKLLFPFAKVGLIPDSGALWFLARMVGTSRAWDICVTGTPIDARRAQDLGLFHNVVTADRFDSTWRGLARELATGPTVAYRLTKSLLADALDRELDDQLESEIDAQAEAGRSQDHLEGVRAFLEKRPPRFSGN